MGSIAYYTCYKSKGEGWIYILSVFLLASIFISYKIITGPIKDFYSIEMLLPFGIGYYTLRCVHYVLEHYKGNIRTNDIHDISSYLLFVPTLFIGPINRFPAYFRDKKRHRWNQSLFNEGLERIIFGYVKIALLDNFLVNEINDSLLARVDESNVSLVLYITMVKIGISLYLQFSGHSDIAIGFARLLGFKVLENFSWPYLATNISKFWQSWHISLTSWSREYVYMGVISISRSSTLASLSSLIAIGLWHEVSLRYLLWGFYHGLAIVVWQRFQYVKKSMPKITNSLLCSLLKCFSIALTLHYVWLGFLLVRQDSMSDVLLVIKSFIFW